MKKKYLLPVIALCVLALLAVFLYSQVIREKRISTLGGETGDVRQWSRLKNVFSRLHLAWARIPIEWSNIEISRGSYDWQSEEYVNFKEAVASAKGMKAQVIVTVKDAPDFLIDPIYNYSPDGTATPWPAPCGRLTPEGMSALGDFINALLRQMNIDFDVRQGKPLPVLYIELWNEPDVDPFQTVRPDLYGCWQRGGPNGPPIDGTPPAYDAGAYYARVLDVVAPAVKARYPEIKFVAGAASSASSGFLDALIDQALEDIDVVSYHQYVKAPNTVCDIDAMMGIQEKSFSYVRDYLDSHGGSDKPILISEGAIGYTTYGMTPMPEGTVTPAPSFYDCQAKFASKLVDWTQEKASSGKLLGFIWYTIGINGWNETDLLAPNKTPKPVFYDW